MFLFWEGSSGVTSAYQHLPLLKRGDVLASHKFFWCHWTPGRLHKLSPQDCWQHPAGLPQGPALQTVLAQPSRAVSHRESFRASLLKSQNLQLNFLLTEKLRPG